MPCRNAALVLVLCALLSACKRSSPDEPQAVATTSAASSEGVVQESVEKQLQKKLKKKRLGGLEATFYVTADTHFGYGVPKDAPAGRDALASPLGIERVHHKVLKAMQDLPGLSYPAAIGGTVGTPLGVLVAGDLTESGKPEEWRVFLEYYGSSKQLPLYEAVGNHDFWPVRERSIKRHGALWYSWDWGDLHVVCLGEAPGEKALAWFKQDLENLDADVPVVVYMHFPLLGAWSDTWFTREGFDDKFHAELEGHNILGIFHGHYHGSGRYRWRGYDVFNVGSAKHDTKSFGVVHVTDKRFSVASWDYSRGAWEWWQSKQLEED